MCFPNFGLFTLVLEQSASTQGKYYLPPSSYLEQMKVIFLKDWTSVTLFITHIACFPSASCFLKDYHSNRSISPVCTASSESRLMVKAGISAAALRGQTKPGRGYLYCKLSVCKSSLLLKAAVHRNPQTGLLHFGGFSLSFYLAFSVLPFLSFTSYCPSFFYSRKTRHSSHKHPSINCLSYKPLIS